MAYRPKVSLVSGLPTPTARIQLHLQDGDKKIDLEFLRQQIKKTADQPNISLADFIAPESTGKQDYIGAFAVTIHGIEKHIKRFEEQLDDYNKIMLQALPTGWPKLLLNSCIRKCEQKTGVMLMKNIFRTNN